MKGSRPTYNIYIYIFLYSTNLLTFQHILWGMNIHFMIYHIDLNMIYIYLVEWNLNLEITALHSEPLRIQDEVIRQSAVACFDVST